jgi:hypothetical protein
MWIKWRTFIITNRKITIHEAAKMFESFVWVSLQHLERQPEDVLNCCLACLVRTRKITQTRAWASSKGLKETQIPVKDHHVVWATGVWIWPRYPASLLIGRTHHLHWGKKKGLGRGKQVPSSVKIMLIVFYDIHGVVHYKFVPQVQTVNWQHYTNQLSHLYKLYSKLTQKVKLRKMVSPQWQQTWLLCFVCV